MRSLLIIWAIIFTFTAPIRAEKEQLRLAIIASDEATAFADVLTATLSKNSSLELIERNELIRIEQEAKLGKLSNSERSLKIARLAKAESLLFIEIQKEKNSTSLLSLRLVACNNGSIIRSLALPFLSKKLDETASITSKQLSPYFQRLSKISFEKVKTISFQGLRASVGDRELQEFENILNIRLTHHLGNQSDLVLLERWQLNDVVFERSLNAEKSQPLATGTQLLDGAIEKSRKGVEFRIRIRNSESDPGEVFKINTSSDDATAVVDSIVAEISKKILGQTQHQPWKAENEAAAYTELGSWLVQHHLNIPAAQAFETAIALGDHSQQALAGRIRSYAKEAYPRDFGVLWRQDGGYVRNDIKAEDLPRHLELAIRAVQHTTDYIKSAPNQEGRVSHFFRPYSLGNHVFYVAIRVLRTVHDNRLHIKLSTPTQALRNEVWNLVQALDNFQTSDIDVLGTYRIHKVGYAAYWCPTPEATLAYYKKVLTLSHWPEFRGSFLPLSGWDFDIRDRMNENPHHGPYLDGEPSKEEVSRPSTVRLIDWKTENPDSTTKAWKEFIYSLKKSSKPIEQADGLAFEINSLHGEAQRQRAMAEAVDFLWEHRELLAKLKGEIFFISFNSSFRELDYSKKPEAQRKLVELFCYIFDHSDFVSSHITGNLGTLKGNASNLNREDSRALIDAIDRYEKRAKRNENWTKDYVVILSNARNGLVTNVPSLKKIDDDSSALIISSLWNPFPPNVNDWFGRGPLTFAERRLWICTKTGILILNDDGSRNDLIPYPDDPSFSSLWYLTVTKEGVFISAGGDVWRFTLSDKKWSKFRLSTPDHMGSQLYKVGSEVWAAFGRDGVFGVARLRESDPDWLVSSRRRPAKHPLDTGSFEGVAGVLLGPGNRAWVGFRAKREQKIYFYDLDAPGKPLLTIPNNRWMQLRCEGSRTLIWDTRGLSGEFDVLTHVWLVDATKSKPELLLGHPKHIDPNDAFKPRWSYFDIISNEITTQDPRFCPVMRGDDLWILRWEYSPANGHPSLVLFGFLNDTDKTIRIPLKIKLSEEQRSTLPEWLQNYGFHFVTQPDVKPERVAAIKSGFIFGGDQCCYLIPWTEIEAWIKKSRNSEEPNSPHERSSQNTKALKKN